MNQLINFCISFHPDLYPVSISNASVVWRMNPVHTPHIRAEIDRAVLIPDFHTRLTFLSQPAVILIILTEIIRYPIRSDNIRY